MSNLQQYVDQGNLGAAKTELEKMLMQQNANEVWKEALETNSIELVFYVFKKLKPSLGAKDLSIMMETLEKDFGTVIHGEDVVGLRRLKNEISEAIEQLTGVQRTTNEMGNITDVSSFVQKVKSKRKDV
jgi:tRNA nucleotidyltransferase/poly(A) polymerase